MSNRATLSDWSIVRRGGEYTPPECMALCLSGLVAGHPSYKDGARVTTSRIVAAEGRVITVESRRVYELIGDPEPAYVEHLEKIGHVYDPAHPIVVKCRAQESTS